MKLEVNIDHIATLRQARYVGEIDAHNARAGRARGGGGV